MPRISHLVAMSANRVIGRENGIPWRLPRDVHMFKTLTMGHTMIMGRRTWDSLPRKPLPGRRTIIVTRDETYRAPGAEVVTNVDDAYALCAGEDEVFVIGGAQIFKETFNSTDRIYLSEIHQAIDGDVFYPVFDPADWTVTEKISYQADGPQKLDWDFVIYDRIR